MGAQNVAVAHRFALPCASPAGWQSGYAADCKSVYAGSIPASASNSVFPTVAVPRPPLAADRMDSQATERSARVRAWFPLAAGIAINLAIGILYAWSVLVAPFELLLSASRAEVSGAQSLGFFMATVGTFTMHWLLRWFSLAMLALVIGVMSALGLALAGFGQSLAALYLGYGVLFGYGSGVLYFVAMTAAGIKGPVRKSIAIGANMAAVALGGILWSPALASMIETLGPTASVGIAAAILLAATTLGYALIAASGARLPSGQGATGLFEDMLTESPRIAAAIFFGFLCVAFAALAVVGHAATLMASWGAAASETRLAPMLNGAGYAIGALIGGPLTELLTGRRVLIGVGLAMGGLLLALYLAPGIAVGLAAVAVVGGCFGATASAHPLAIAGYYGADAMPRVYGRLAVAYGIGGLLGPFVAGAIFDADRHYGTAVILAACVALLGAACYACLPRGNFSVQRRAQG